MPFNPRAERGGGIPTEPESVRTFLRLRVTSGLLPED